MKDFAMNIAGYFAPVKYLLPRKIPIFEKEKVIQVVTVIRDITERLRSPLVTIQGFTDMVQTDLAQNEIEKAATKMDRLFSDTLELSRIGRIANPPENVPFGEIVRKHWSRPLVK